MELVARRAAQASSGRSWKSARTSRMAQLPTGFLAPACFTSN